MPELPDVTVYVEALERRVAGQGLERIRIRAPFVLRSLEPTAAELEGRRVAGVRRLGKRVVIELAGEHFIVIHLMIAGRLHWKPQGAKIGSRNDLFALDFTSGTLTMTEAGTKRRASLHFVRGREALAAHDPGGIEPLTASLDEFSAALTRERHTLKRTLTDPRVFSGIGNAFSDEILHAARLSPLQLTTNLKPPEIEALFHHVKRVLTVWTERLREQTGEGFPEKVTAFRPEMAVHGKYGQPCPMCGSPVQRIRYAENEANYCATCQTGGRLLADRAMSRLLKDDWPRSLDAWEQRLAKDRDQG
jgi:formamidopyrimidine-DNA glycosylase